jgi:hypothetical protein
MSKKISITLLFTMVFAIVALFAATRVLAEPGSQIDRLGSVFKFVDIDGREHIGSYILNPDRTEIEKLKVDGKDVSTVKGNKLNLFRFCIPDPKGKILIDNQQYSCHKPVDVTNEAAFVGNSGSCPWFIKPPGIWFDPCELLSQ